MSRGIQREFVPVRPAAMAKACRDLAALYRDEHETKPRMVPLTRLTGPGIKVTCLDAAASLEAQAERWEHEIATGIPNARDREAIGA